MLQNTSRRIQFAITISVSRTSQVQSLERLQIARRENCQASGLSQEGGSPWQRAGDTDSVKRAQPAQAGDSRRPESPAIEGCKGSVRQDEERPTPRPWQQAHCTSVHYHHRSDISDITVGPTAPAVRNRRHREEDSDGAIGRGKIIIQAPN